MWPLFTGGERIRCFRAAAWKRKLSLRPLPIDRSGLPADLLEPRHVLGLFFRRVLHTRLNKKSYRDEFSIVTEKKKKRKKIEEEWNKKECCVNQNLLNSTRNLVEDRYRRKNWFFFFLFAIRLFVVICNIKMIYSRSFLFSVWTIWTKSKKMNRILKEDSVSIPRRSAFISVTRILLRLISAVEEDIWQLSRIYFTFQFEVGWIQGKSRFPSSRYAVGGDCARFTAFKSSFIDGWRGRREEEVEEVL